MGFKYGSTRYYPSPLPSALRAYVLVDADRGVDLGRVTHLGDKKSNNNKNKNEKNEHKEEKNMNKNEEKSENRMGENGGGELGEPKL